MTPPDFWYDTRKKPFFIFEFFLWLISKLIYAGSLLRNRLSHQNRVSIPVICIGNFTVGGAGKTPMTLRLAHYFKGQGTKVAILSKGYRGRLLGPVRVDPLIHTSLDVGDESLMMARYHPVYVSKDRYEGAKLAEKDGANVILMDDGLQNPKLHQDFKVSVIDAVKGFGNKKLLPLGPLREPLGKALQRVDAFVSIATSDEIKFQFDKVGAHVRPEKTPHLRSSISLNKEDWANLKGKKLVAFAGLAHPDKFFKTLEHEKFDVVETHSFDDHHVFSKAELDRLFDHAKKRGAHLVTTEKDWVRLPKEAQDKVLYLRITLDFEETDQFRCLFSPFTKK